MSEAYVGYYHYGFEMVSVDRRYTDMSGVYTTSSVPTVKLTNIRQTSLVKGCILVEMVIYSRILVFLVEDQDGLSSHRCP